MKRSKVTDSQIAFILRQAEDGTRLEEVCRKAGISPATFYNWKKDVWRSHAVGDEAPEAA